MRTDRTETRDVAGYYPQIVKKLTGLYNRWAVRCGVMPRKELMDKGNKS